MSQNSIGNPSINMNSQLARQLIAPMSPAKTSVPYHHNVRVVLFLLLFWFLFNVVVVINYIFIKLHCF